MVVLRALTTNPPPPEVVSRADFPLTLTLFAAVIVNHNSNLTEPSVIAVTGSVAEFSKIVTAPIFNLIVAVPGLLIVVNETKRALEEGIVVGGDTAYLHVLRALKTPSSLNKEQLLGYQLVLDSLSAPLRQIVLNSNDKPDVIEHGILNSEYPAGYDAIERKIVPDMIKEGIIDAVKVTKTVLQYAVKEAGLFLTISGDISEEVKID